MASRKPAKPDHSQNSSSEMQQALAGADDQRYVLKLYVTGITPKSTEAIRNVKGICENRLQGRYTLEVIDVFQQPEKAKSDNIIAAPTLIKLLPTPLRRMIGDMANTERILIGLGLHIRE